MSQVDEIYKSLLEDILINGDWRENRTGIDTKEVFSRHFVMDMREGFPTLTLRRVPFKSAMVELEGFIKGITDKSWYQDNGCKFWDYWCDPRIHPYASIDDPEGQEKMREEKALGEIYGAQWRNFHDPCVGQGFPSGDYTNTFIPSTGIDQLKILVDKIKARKDDRRLIVSAWNPMALNCMALVPCHYEYIVHLSPCGKYIDLDWSQRSVDVPIGLPSNIVSYAALLTLLANDAGLIPRYLIGSLKNCHIYRNQIPAVKKLLEKESHEAPTFHLKYGLFDDTLSWKHSQCELKNYKNSGVVEFPRPAV